MGCDFSTSSPPKLPVPSLRRKARHAPRFSPFPFIYFRTLSFSVSSKSFACHSHENCRVCTNNSHFETQRSRIHPCHPLPTVLCQPHVLSFHTLVHSLALFCTSKNINSFIFKQFRTLRQKTKRAREPLWPRPQFSAQPSLADHRTRFPYHESRTQSPAYPDRVGVTI